MEGYIVFHRRNLIFFIVFFTGANSAPLPLQAKIENNQSNHEETWLKDAGKSIGGYFFGLCTSAALLTAFTNLENNNPSNAYIAAALATSFAGGCLTNYLIHQYPKKTLAVLGVITITLVGITTYAYCS